MQKDNASSLSMVQAPNHLWSVQVVSLFVYSGRFRLIVTVLETSVPIYHLLRPNARLACWALFAWESQGFEDLLRLKVQSIDCCFHR